jgi:hypothetical protein
MEINGMHLNQFLYFCRFSFCVRMAAFCDLHDPIELLRNQRIHSRPLMFSNKSTRNLCLNLRLRLWL